MLTPRDDLPTGKLSFAEAFSWAEQLELYGVLGWRLPVVRPLDANGCVAGHVSVFCGVVIAAEPSELWDLMHDSLALESIHQSGPRPNSQDDRSAAAEAERLHIPGRDAGVSSANVMPYCWLAGLRRESSECPPGSTCDQSAEPMPLPVGGSLVTRRSELLTSPVRIEVRGRGAARVGCPRLSGFTQRFRLHGRRTGVAMADRYAQ